MKRRRDYKRREPKLSPIKEPSEEKVSEELPEDGWAPSSQAAFKALLTARLSAAIWSNISDCDEVYNYWEPTHFLTYGSGFQTWEYSPVYALRSYVYICFHALPSLLYGASIQSNKVLVFYFVRCTLALACALCEVYFYRGVLSIFGGVVARLCLLFLVFAPGMYISSAAYLPSSFSMYMVLLGYGALLRGELELSLVSLSISVLIGWPFSVAIGFPLVLYILLRKEWLVILRSIIIAVFFILIPMIYLDSQLYGRFVLAPMNLVMYNVFTPHGADLYGTEPALFYFANGILNFNIVFPLALVTPFVLLFHYHFVEKSQSTYTFFSLIMLMAMLLWLVIFNFQSHKEERFLFPANPLVCLSAALCLVQMQKFVKGAKQITLVICCVFMVLSVSRIVALYKGYRAPIETYMELGKIADTENISRDKIINVCVGKEWHRFPSSFFLPANNWRLEFVKSEFKGQLPKHYPSTTNATSLIPSHMNDQNLEEPSRYIHIRHCHFLVDLDSSFETTLEPNYSELKSNWTSVFSVPFLEASRSMNLFRSFYIPWLSEYYCKYRNYHLLRNFR